MKQNNLGNYDTIYDVWSAYPEGGKEGDYLFIDGVEYVWDKYGNKWMPEVSDEDKTLKSFYGEVDIHKGLHVGEDVVVNGNLITKGAIISKKVSQPSCGLFSSVEALQKAYPKPYVGMWAAVGNAVPAPIYRCETIGVWTPTGDVGYADGRPGKDGEKGDKGDTGERGPQGLQGNSGYTGAADELEVVNNLTQGGATAALSAEAGRGLHYRVTDLEEFIGNNNVTEDISSEVINGNYTFSSTEVGTATTATHNPEGAWRCLSRAVKAGEKYIISGEGGGIPRLYCLVDSNNVIQAIAPSGDVQSNFELRIEENGTLYCNVLNDGTYKIERKSTGATLSEITNVVNENKAAIETHETRIDNLESITDGLITDVTEDISSEVINGNYTFSSTEVGTATTATHNPEGAWRCLSRAVKAGEKYIISGEGGGIPRLYCLVDSNNVIQAIAPSGDVQSNFELRIEENGTLYCNVLNDGTYKIERKSTQVNNIGGGASSLWENGSFEFGRTCDCNYTAPNINGYSLPDSNKVAAIYGWYDELLARYPKYVTRENCDDVMASIGVSKPSVISSLPMYMYKFIPPKSPNSNGYSDSESSAQMIKAFILTGTHNEYTAVWDCYNAMRLICEEWSTDKNLEELRWNAEIYVIPCYNLYGVDNSTRTNENGVDLNRNAPTIDWKPQGSYGDSTYSGTSAGSEYSTKVMMHYFSILNPQVFIDHHNTNVGAGTTEGDGKNMIYTHSLYQIGIDISSIHISQMTRKWKQRYTDTFPSVEDDPNVLFGFTSDDTIKGSIGRYAAEQGALGTTYESNFGILYKNGIYSTSNRQTNNAIVSTCATEGFINYLLRNLKAYTNLIGVKSSE